MGDGPGIWLLQREYDDTPRPPSVKIAGRLIYPPRRPPVPVSPDRRFSPEGPGLASGLVNTEGELWSHEALSLARAPCMWGPTFPELVEALPGVPIIDRSSVNAFDDPEVAQAINATGRTKLIFAGISLEVCAAFPAITAVGKGLDAYVAVDASGTFSETKRQVGLLRMLQAGVILSDYATLMVEIPKDNARAEATAVYGAMDMPWAKLVGQIAQAYAK